MLFSRFVVSGRSMEPTFCAGDCLLVLNLNLLLKKGDVVILRDSRDDRLVLKRVAKMDDSIFFVKGDNEDFSTDSRTFGPVSKKNLIGKVLLRYKHLKL